MISPEFKSEIASRFSSLLAFLKGKGLIKDQLTLARLFDVSKQSVSDMQNGKRLPTLEHIHILAKELKVNPNWLINGDDPMFQEETDHQEDIIVMITRAMGTGAIDQLKGEKIIQHIRQLQTELTIHKDEIAKQRNEIIELIRLGFAK